MDMGKQDHPSTSTDTLVQELDRLSLGTGDLRQQTTGKDKPSSIAPEEEVIITGRRKHGLQPRPRTKASTSKPSPGKDTSMVPLPLRSSHTAPSSSTGGTETHRHH